MTIRAEQSENDQASELRELLNEITETEVQEEYEENSPSEREIDILQLPPRKDVHESNKIVGIKLSKPFLRLAFISLLVALVIIGALYIWDGEFFF